MGLMRIKYGLLKSRPVTLTRALGPTTSVIAGARGTLPQPAPTDLNAFFVAPNGSDAGTGDEADPFLTIAFAATQLTAGRPTLVLIRNGFAGDLVWNEGGIALAATRNMQAEVGEAPTINLDVVSAITLDDNCWINGIWIRATGNTPPIIGSSAGPAFLRLENCGVDSPYEDAIAAGDYYPILASTFIRFGKIGFQGRYSNSASIDSCAFVGTMLATFDTSEGTPTRRALNLQTDTAGNLSQSFDVVRTFFASMEVVWEDGDSVNRAALGHRLRFRGCATQDILTSMASVLATLTTTNLRLVLDYTRFAGRSWSLYTTPYTTTSFDVPAGMVSTISNALPTDNTILLANYAGALAGDPAGLKLQVEARGVDSASATSPKYGVTSPLHQAATALALGVGRADAAPWSETVMGMTMSFTRQNTLQFDPRTLKITDRLVNPQTVTSIRGNPYRTYDAKRWRFEYAWPSGGSAQSRRDRAILVEVYGDNGSKLLYPLGPSGNLFIDPDDVPIAVTGDWVESTGVLTLNTPTLSLIPGNWRGRVVELTDFGSLLLIVDNGFDTLTLVDVFEFGTPGLNVLATPFIVPACFVQCPPDDLSVDQSTGNTNFRRGGAMSEDTGTQDPYAYEGLAFTLDEVDTPVDITEF